MQLSYPFSNSGYSRKHLLRITLAVRNAYAKIRKNGMVGRFMDFSDCYTHSNSTNFWKFL